MMSATTATAESRDKTVTGYPAQPGQVAAGYPSGTAYPYVAPPPSNTYSYSHYQTNLPVGPTYNYNQRRRGPSSLLCRLITAATVVFAIMGLLFIITWLILKPRLPEFRVDAASVSQLNATRSQLTATWNVTLFIRNPNTKLTIYYDRLEASVFYGSDSQLSTTPLPPFFQDKRNETRVRVILSALQEYVGEEIVNKVSAEQASGSVRFRIRVFAWVRLRTGYWWMRQRLLRVYCDRVQIGFAPNYGTGILTGQSRACEVDL